ncbi:hypothetical protein B0A49_00488 [Cryomyces minteri]|uniref:DUF7726 domain-containing protein n=1 Tax=Cryomyces minteri TaxID=331657 RepID=A0A4U0XYY3_9PEZI|nr:hypothetical protein B0A49_00488 [Cryomyces minteri]
MAGTKKNSKQLDVASPPQADTGSAKKPYVVDDDGQKGNGGANKENLPALEGSGKGENATKALSKSPLSKSKSPSTAKAGDKRKSTDAHGVDLDSIDMPNYMPLDKDCDQIRRMIHTFIDSGEMKVGDFRDAIGVSSTSYTNFLGQEGRSKGMHSETYNRAWEFFKKREIAGLKMPKKQKTSTAEQQTKDLSAVHLDGEEIDMVTVYDTCDEMRKKISAHLRKDGVTQAAFLRDLAAQFHTDTKRIQGSQLNSFRSKKGADAGNTSSVFYAAYCFFEKLRIKEGKPKSKHREDMERIWGYKGFNIERPSHRGVYVMEGQHPTRDQCECLSSSSFSSFFSLSVCVDGS